MVIQAEATPNPTTLKVLPGRVVLAESTVEALISKLREGVTDLGLVGHSGCRDGSQEREEIPP